MALALHTSCPAPANTATASNSFTPPDNSGILACWGNNANNASLPTGISGGGLSWGSPIASITAETFSSASLWWANCPTSPGSMTVSFTGGVNGGIMILVFTGAHTTQDGAHNTQTGSSASADTVTTPGGGTIYDNSWCFGVQTNYSNATGPTFAAGRTNTDPNTVAQTAIAGTPGNAAWAIWTTAQNGAAGSAVTLNVTAPSPNKWAACLMEVRPGAAAPPITDAPETLIVMHAGIRG